MNIDLQARDFPLTLALQRHIRRRLDFAFSSRYDQIHRIRVCLSDVNGPRGGADKRCQVHVQLPQLHDVIVEDTERDMYAAISRAADRAREAVTRRLTRHRDRTQRVMRPPAGFVTDAPAASP